MKSSFAFGAFVWGVVLSIGAAAQGGTIPVFPGLSIQAAIASAQDGDRIELAAGAYVEAIDFLGKEITVTGVGGSSHVLLDGIGVPGALVTFASGEGPGAVLEGVTIANANVNQVGGGVRIQNFSSPTLRDCRFIGNTAWKGGALLIADSSATLEHCFFEGNVATQPGGFPGSVPGGGILTYGGGLLRLEDCTFRGNTGGGLAAYLAGTVELERCRFEDHAGATAVTIRDNNVEVADCVFLRNTERALDVDTKASVYVRRSTFLDNGHPTAFGGALNAFAGATGFGQQVIRVESCVFARNEGLFGSAARLVIDNEVIGPAPQDAILVDSCTFVDNVGGEAIHALQGGSFGGVSCLTLRNSIVRGAAGAVDGDPGEVIAHCDVEGGAVGPGNFDLDPLFADAAHDDYHLLVGSPCVGAGDPSAPAPLDLDGNLRDAPGNNDVGADERKPALSIAGDLTIGSIVRLGIHGEPSPAPAILFLGAAPATAPGPFQLAFPVIPIVLIPLPASGYLQLPAGLPGGIQPATVYAQAWTGAELTNAIQFDLW